MSTTTDNLIDMMHAHVQERDAEKKASRPPKEQPTFYPFLVGQCRRKIGYHMTDTPAKPLPPEVLMIMENGTSFHNRCEELMHDMGIAIADEVSIKRPDLHISGRTDVLIKNFLSDKRENQEDIKLYDGKGTDVVYEGPENEVLLVELKSIKNKKYYNLPKTKPEKNHELQLQLYMHLTGIRQGLVFYENKDNQDMTYYVCNYEPKQAERVLGDIDFILEYINKDDLPPRDYEPTSFECLYCEFRDTCYPNHNPYDLESLL